MKRLKILLHAITVRYGAKIDHFDRSLLGVYPIGDLSHTLRMRLVGHGA